MKSQNGSNSPADSNGQRKTVTYKFVTGETSVVEVSEEIAAFLVEADKAEHALAERERSHCLSTDAAAYEGIDYSDGVTPEAAIFLAVENDASTALLQKAIASLTAVQKRRLLMLVTGMKYEEIAHIEGVCLSSLAESIEAANKKIFLIYPKKRPQNLRIVRGFLFPLSVP